jgi:hypothetical protein
MIKDNRLFRFIGEYKLIKQKIKQSKEAITASSSRKEPNEE